MSTISDFNRIEDCDKIDARCVNAYAEAKLNEDDPKILEVNTSWGDNEVDLSPAIKAEETLTTLYLSPTESPNCLIYEPERGDNICIRGDDLSRTISMQKLKDVEQVAPADGIVYEYDETEGLFRPFDLKTFVANTNAAVAALQARITTLEQTIADHETRIQVVEAKLVPPTGAPDSARVAFTNINIYSDHTAQIDSNGNVVSLDKTHGVYGHDLSTNALDDEIMG